MELTAGVWNAEWAEPSTARGERVASRIAGLEADLVALTEGHRGLLPVHGDLIESDGSWGYEPEFTGPRKVLLWSQQQWRDVDRVGSRDLPPGRWVAGTTDTPLGDVRVVGICIPWFDAHVSTGRSDAQRWEDHRTFLAVLPDLLAAQPRPLVVVGDFNQRIPRATQPHDVADALRDALGPLQVATEGEVDGSTRIDHVAHSEDLKAEVTGSIPQHDESGPMSDHVGAVVTLSRRADR